MRIFARVLWRVGVKQQWEPKKLIFGLRTLRLRHLCYVFIVEFVYITHVTSGEVWEAE